MTATRPFLVGHRTHSPAVAARYTRAGVTRFELDVRVVADRVIVTHYRPVRCSLGLLERDNTRLRRRTFPPPDCTLAEVLAALPAGAQVVFDPKDREPWLRARLVQRLAAAIDEPGRHVVSTRSRRDLALFADAGFRTWWTLDTPDQIRRVAGSAVPADGVTVRQRALSPAAVRLLHGVTDTVVAWTARSVPRACELAGFGVDGITTHDAAVMAAVRSSER